jgi:hypothetical protein
MDAKLKAKELVEKFMQLVYCYSGSGMLTNSYDDDIAKQNAKACAIICVDEIMKSYEETNSHHGSVYEYWQSVKTEIQKL